MPETYRPGQVSNKLMMSADDLWLLRLFVLIRAAKERISEESLRAELDRRKIGGITSAVLRRLLSSLAGSGLIQLIQGDGSVFIATRQGRKAARETLARLSPLIALLDD